MTHLELLCIEEMKKFIAVTLETLEIPLANLYVRGTRELEEKDVWDKKRIVELTRPILTIWTE